MPPPTVRRHKYLLGSPPYDVEHDISPLVAGADVEKNQFVCPFEFVAGGHFDRIPRVAEVHEIRSLHDTTAVDVEAGNDAFSEHGNGSSAVD